MPFAHQPVEQQNASTWDQFEHLYPDEATRIDRRYVEQGEERPTELMDCIEKSHQLVAAGKNIQAEALLHAMALRIDHHRRDAAGDYLREKNLNPNTTIDNDWDGHG